VERMVLSKSAWLRAMRESMERHDEETDGEASWDLYVHAARQWCDQWRAGMYEVTGSETVPMHECRNTVDLNGAMRHAQGVVRSMGIRT
jgi:hypothetical protein